MADVDRNFNNLALTEKIPKNHQTIRTSIKPKPLPQVAIFTDRSPQGS
jgi:hypothetical protein